MVRADVTAEMEDDWKALGEDWVHGHPAAHRGMGLDEDVRASDSFPSSMGMAAEHMMQHGMNEQGVSRRRDQRSYPGSGGLETFYNGHGQGNGAPYNGAGGKDDAHVYPAEEMRAVHEAPGHGEYGLVVVGASFRFTSRLIRALRQALGCKRQTWRTALTIRRWVII